MCPSTNSELDIAEVGDFGFGSLGPHGDWRWRTIPIDFCFKYAAINATIIDLNRSRSADAAEFRTIWFCYFVFIRNSSSRNWVCADRTTGTHDRLRSSRICDPCSGESNRVTERRFV